MEVELIETDLPVGVIGVIYGTAAGPQAVTAFRADLDALPIQEQTGLEYSSQNPGVMHACGHDGHTAVLLGTARLLQEHKMIFSSTVLLIFQAAQETLAGAKDVIATGILDDQKVDNIIALHSWPFLDAGQVGVYPGQAQASSDTFIIRVAGKSGHVSRPWLAKNPILAACLVVNTLNGLVSRELAAGHRALVGVTGINGGKGFNVIPDTVEITGAIRCLDPDDQDRLQDMLFKTAEETAKSMGCTAEIEYTRVCPSMANTPEVAMQFRTSAAAVLGEENACLLSEPSLGSEDFAYYVHHVGRGLNARHLAFQVQDNFRCLLPALY